MSTVTVNGNTYSDDGTASRDLTNGGHRQHLLPMLADAVVDLAAKADLATTNGAAQVALAEAAANAAAASANFKGAWSGLTGPLAVPASVAHNNQIWMLLVGVADVTTKEPGGAAEWALLNGGVTRSPRTSNTVLAANDITKLIDIISGTFVQTFAAAATLGDGWYCYIRNRGSGDITLENIDGLASFIMYPGEVRLIQCDGATLTSIVLSPFCKVFVTSGTFVKPPGYAQFAGLMWSGGGSGQRTNSISTVSLGGGGGGCCPFNLAAAVIGATESVVIGAGGPAVSGVANGNKGGNTSFGSLVTVYAHPSDFFKGGSVFSGLETSVVGQLNTYEGGNANPNGGCVWGGNSTLSTTNATRSLYGSGSGGSLTASAVPRAPGISYFGGNGGPANSATSGEDGVAPGGGGGATQTGTTSGNGARGELRIWGIA